MAEDGVISDALAAALERYVDDIEQLEIILYLRRGRDRYHSSTTIAAELFMTEDAAARQLERLGKKNLLDVRIENAVLVRYNPVSPEVEKAIDDIAEAFATRRVEVLRAIGALKPDPAHAFAEAFRFGPRKKKPKKSEGKE